MNSLTTEELRFLNFLSQAVNPDVFLGTKLQSLIDETKSRMVLGTPTNAKAATGVLNITGVVIDGETVNIGNDIYEFLADEAQSKSNPLNIAVDITDDVGFATGALTMDAQPDSGETVTIGTKVYTFVPVGTDTADGEVSVGADLAGAKSALVAAINGTDGINEPNPDVIAIDFAGDDMVVTARVGGSAGNDIITTETFGAVTNIFASNKLSTGTDCSAANAMTALVAAITANTTEDVEAEVNAGKIDITATVSGIAGNMVVDTNMVNGAFTEETLLGGANGTIGKAGEFMLDTSYLYVCVADNSISGTNWRRFTVGSQF